MNNSSVQQDYLTTLDDLDLGDITIDLGNTQSYTCSTMDVGSITLSGGSNASTVVLGGSSSNYAFSNNMSTTGNLSSDTITISNIDFNWAGTTEWVDGFPDWGRVQEMCETYPGLKVAFDRLKVVYDLVKDDFDTPPEKRIKP
jgi:hypothetical protein